MIKLQAQQPRLKRRTKTRMRRTRKVKNQTKTLCLPSVPSKDNNLTQRCFTEYLCEQTSSPFFHITHKKKIWIKFKIKMHVPYILSNHNAAITKFEKIIK